MKRIALSPLVSRFPRFRQTYVRTNVTATLVKELRERSGAPMMDCKKALSAEEVNGDITKAMDWLRKKGIAKATGGGRAATEGLIAIITRTDGFKTLIEINSETDFVSMNTDFQSFVTGVATAVNGQCKQSGDLKVEDVLTMSICGNQPIQSALGDIISSIRENIVLQRAKNFAPSPVDSEGKMRVISSYVHAKVGDANIPEHIQMGRMAAVVELELSNIPEDTVSHVAQEASSIGFKLAMHVVASSPVFLDQGAVPQEVMDREMQIFREQTEADQRKKPEMIERIVEGKVRKRLTEICLLDQNHMAEEGTPVVRKHLEQVSKVLGCECKVVGFTHWVLGSSQKS